MRLRFAAALSTFCLLLQAPALRAQSPQARNLEGLDSIRVMVDRDIAVADFGPNASTVQTKMEIFLRRQGVRLTKTKTSPYLLINMKGNMRGGDTGACMWDIDVELRKPDPSKEKLVFGIVWSNRVIGAEGECLAAKDEMLRQIQELVNIFAVDYATVNLPK